jgi:transposase
MPQYTINSKHASIIALDTHARTTTIKGVALETGEEKAKRFNSCPTSAEIASWIQVNFPAPQYVAYESGCTGFYLCRELRELGIECDVIAVSSIPKSTDDVQRKNDKRDAKGLLQALLTPNNSLSAVWMPDEECEGVRDILRAYRDAQGALKRVKQQLIALLLRHGWVWNEKTPSGTRRVAWGLAYMKWLDGITLESIGANEALLTYRAMVSEGADRIGRLKKRIDYYANEKRWKPYVDAFCLIKGISVYSAMVYATEIGDFFRFKNGRGVSKWAGVIPKSHASGETKEANGKITKAGNVQVRNALVEGIQSALRRSPAMGKIKADCPVSERVIAECNKCNHRLHERYHHLLKDLKKKPNVAKVAVANEMIRWVWAIGCLVQQEQGALVFNESLPMAS